MKQIDEKKMAPKKSLQERILDADVRTSRLLGDANEAAERGDHAKADALYVKCQFWLDRYNKLKGYS